MELERGRPAPARMLRRLPARGDEEENEELAKEPAVGAAVVLLAVVFALDAYRAVTQSITHDEALTFLTWAPGPIERVFTMFIANNHVLHTLGVWASVRAFGIHEWAVRLPALLGGLLYLVSSWRVCRRAFGGGWAFLLGFGLLALHPLLLDFQSLARGYGLALGLAMYAIANLLGALAGHESGRGASAPHVRMAKASAALGLSVAANLTLAPLAVALVLVTIAAVLGQRRRLPGGARTGGHALTGVAAVLVPGAAVAAALLYVPLSHHKPGGFFVGTQSLLATGSDMVQHALAHVPEAWPLSPDGELYAYARAVLLVLGGPVLLLAELVRLAIAVRRWRRANSLAELGPTDRFHVLVGGALVLGLLALVVAHHAFGFAYPIDRTGLWLVAVVHLVAVGLAADALRVGATGRAVGLTVLLGLWVLLVQYGSQIQAREYAVWRYDAGMRQIFGEIRRENDRDPHETVVVQCGWYYEPALNFYRLAGRAQWMAPVERGYDPEHLTGDWLVLNPAAEPRPVDELVDVRWRDPVSGTVLGRPLSRAASDAPTQPGAAPAAPRQGGPHSAPEPDDG